MKTGLKIKCKKNPMQWLITEQPVCVINSVKDYQLKWGRQEFINLQPNEQSRITIYFPYMGGEAAGATFTVTLEQGEIRTLEYITPFVITTPGKIRWLD